MNTRSMKSGIIYRISVMLLLLVSTAPAILEPFTPQVEFITNIAAAITIASLAVLARKITIYRRAAALNLPAAFAIASAAVNIVWAFNAITLLATRSAQDAHILWLLFTGAVAYYTTAFALYRWHQLKTGSYIHRFKPRRRLTIVLASSENVALNKALDEWSADPNDPCRRDFIVGWQDYQNNRSLNPPPGFAPRCAYHSGYIAAREALANLPNRPSQKQN